MQRDCLAFLGLAGVGVAAWSPPALLYELLLRFGLARQAGLVSREQFRVAIRRLLNVETKSGEFLARYAGRQVLEVLPADEVLDSISQFVVLSYKLVTDNSSELAIEQLKLRHELKMLQERRERLKRNAQHFSSYVQCCVCGRSILRQGAMQDAYYVLPQDGPDGDALAAAHVDCYERRAEEEADK